jgi:hypothetical protein
VGFLEERPQVDVDRLEQHPVDARKGRSLMPVE